MVLDEKLTGPVAAWVEKNEGEECKGEARQPLLEHLADMQPEKSLPQLQSQLTRLLSFFRGGNIKPEYTNKAYERRTLGAPSSHSKEAKDVRNAIHNPIHNPKYNPINNPKYNPIHNAARKRKRVEEAIARLTAKGLHHVRSCNRPTSRIVWTRRTRNGLGRSKRPHVDACEVHAVLHRCGWQSWRRQSRSPAAQCWWWHAATYAATSPIAQQTPRYVRPCRLGTRRETEEPHGLRYEG
jgi:hypothetical protein